MSRIGRPAPPRLPKNQSKTEERKVWFDEAAELRRQRALWCHFTERDFEEAKRKGSRRPDDER